MIAFRRSAGLVAAVALLPLIAASGRAQVRRLDDGLARTPPMGWNTWNKFGCDVSEKLIQETADAMVASGMRDAGYRYVVIDDCWQVARDSAGAIVADSQRFPHGIKAVADYVHAKGLLFGIYTDAGSKTCQGRPGTLDHEAQDARTYASWGVDYVKEDWCNSRGLTAPVQYRKFHDALVATGRPIVLSLCEWGSNRPWEWAAGIGHLWRTTGDIEDTWASMLANLDASSPHQAVAGPGGWNDPDMLEVGNGGMTDDEYRAHLSLWAIVAAPLIAGNDLRTMSAATRDILTNREVLAVDQDSLGTEGWLAEQVTPGLQVWVKPLAGGGRAVALLNRTDAGARIAVDWPGVGLARGAAAQVRDLWAHAERGRHVGSWAAQVPAHGIVLVKITPARGR
ncbi:MAG TPA: glycoside hydrolase family 27 protein [Gemmatimonadales bacterium]|nr:glycoside hydrolase family 27 protein [Gemmatimonadales bacterium]